VAFFRTSSLSPDAFLPQNMGGPLDALIALSSDGTVSVEPTAFEEAVTHHALAKQKKDDRQDDPNQELSNSERGWLSSCTSTRIQRSCHQI
jgi:hypothetical protein